MKDYATLTAIILKSRWFFFFGHKINVKSYFCVEFRISHNNFVVSCPLFVEVGKQNMGSGMLHTESRMNIIVRQIPTRGPVFVQGVLYVSKLQQMRKIKATAHKDFDRQYFQMQHIKIYSEFYIYLNLENGSYKDNKRCYN